MLPGISAGSFDARPSGHARERRAQPSREQLHPGARAGRRLATRWEQRPDLQRRELEARQHADQHPELDGQDVTKSKIEVSIEAASSNTNGADRDTHLKSADSFDAATFSHLKFVSQKIEQVSGGGLRVLGQLEIRGVKKAVALDVEPLTAAGKDPWGGTRRGTRATTRLSRKDFGLNWNAALELGGVLVGDEIEITLEIELVQK